MSLQLQNDFFDALLINHQVLSISYFVYCITDDRSFTVLLSKVVNASLEGHFLLVSRLTCVLLWCKPVL